MKGRSRELARSSPRSCGLKPEKAVDRTRLQQEPGGDFEGGRRSRAGPAVTKGQSSGIESGQITDSGRILRLRNFLVDNILYSPLFQIRPLSSRDRKRTRLGQNRVVPRKQTFRLEGDGRFFLLVKGALTPNLTRIDL